MNALRTLQSRQSAMQAWLLHGDPGIADAIAPARMHGETRADRLRTHADAYRLRLADVRRLRGHHVLVELRLQSRTRLFRTLRGGRFIGHRNGRHQDSGGCRNNQCFHLEYSFHG